jgi:hypothetical protein
MRRRRGEIPPAGEVLKALPKPERPGRQRLPRTASPCTTPTAPAATNPLATYVARQAIWDRLGREVDPEGKLTPQQRAVLIQSAAKRLSAKLNAAKASERARRTA